MEYSGKQYRCDSWLGALGAALMLVGDLCLSVIPASPADSGLFQRAAYFSGSWEPWRRPLLRGTLRAMRWSEMKEFVRLTKQGGASLRDQFNKEKKPYLFVGLVCVREAYQGQGYMWKLMELAYAEGARLGVPVPLETDAKSKCDKYVHLGMELAGTRDLGAHGKLYDLVWYPKK